MSLTACLQARHAVTRSGIVECPQARGIRTSVHRYEAPDEGSLLRSIIRHHLQKTRTFYSMIGIVCVFCSYCEGVVCIARNHRLDEKNNYRYSGIVEFIVFVV